MKAIADPTLLAALQGCRSPSVRHTLHGSICTQPSDGARCMSRQVHSSHPVGDITDFCSTKTKLSNNYTNKMRDFNKDVKAASKFRGSVTTVDRITSIYDAAGSLVSTFVPPEKRLLSDFLGHRLGGIAKPKRVRTKTTTGDATTPTSSNSSNLEQHVGGTASSPMTPIQEEDEDLMAAIQEGGKGVMPSTPGKEEAAMGEADKDDGDKALEGPNEPSTPHPDAVDSHFHSRYLTPVQDLALGKQSYNYHEDSTPDKHQPLGGQSEQPSPNGHRAPSNNEMDVDLSPFFAEAYHEPIDSYDGEDVSSQAALDGEVTKNGNYPYEVDDDWYER